MAPHTRMVISQFVLPIASGAAWAASWTLFGLPGLAVVVPLSMLAVYAVAWMLSLPPVRYDFGVKTGRLKYDRPNLSNPPR